jgi:hypothetical protein
VYDQLLEVIVSIGLENVGRFHITAIGVVVIETSAEASYYGKQPAREVVRRTIRQGVQTVMLTGELVDKLILRPVPVRCV